MYETAQKRVSDYVDELLYSNNVTEAFPREALAPVDASASSSRCDLTAIPCFTIDCEDTKDMDDAVSLSRTDEGGYLLGVHIADVSAFVTPGSVLDETAMDRGTSIYLPDRTIPMLPPSLSDDLCSLSAGKRRNAVSVMITLDRDGVVGDYDIFRSVVVSRVKGFYEEANALLAGDASEAVEGKYGEVRHQLSDMHELAELLWERRKEAGAAQRAEGETRAFFIDGDVVLRYVEAGTAERIIQEFMVLANGLVARYLLDRGLPVIQRVHEKTGKMAFYSCTESGHADLAVDSYAHFTSPIRRLADLKTHQILAAYLSGASPEEVWGEFGEQLDETSDVATRRMRRAQSIERAVLRRCEKEYFEARYGGRFSGIAVARTKSGKTLFEIDKLRVLLPSIAPVRAALGERFSFEVGLAHSSGELGLYRVRALSAA